ncbi:MAG: hypothetical protein ABJA78_03975 [Ferruginibacter sp.]
MKKIIRSFNFLLPVFLLAQLNSFAQEEKKEQKKYEFVKNKSVNKSYNVSASEKLNIKNSFGSVEVHTWNKNEIKVDISIEVSANSESLAQKIIDGISVNDGQSGGEVSFKTNIKGNDNSKDGKSTMSVNYTVSMPSSNPLHLSNEFGATVLPDMNGEVDLSSKFGSLTAGALTNIKNIDVEFGKADLAGISSGTLNVKYSKLNVAKMSGNIKMNLEFCGKAKLNYGSSLTGLDIKSSYSSLNLVPSGDPSIAYNISTNFGSFKNNSNAKMDTEKEGEHGPNFDHSYSGKSGGGNVSVKVKSSFGKVILGEASEEEMKEKTKSKHKTASI